MRKQKDLDLGDKFMNKELLESIDAFILKVNDLENTNLATEKSRVAVEKQLNNLAKEIKDNKEAMDIYIHAIDILRQVSDETVQEAYKFLEESINSALAAMFTKTVRQIKIEEFTRGVQYPQLVIKMGNGAGKYRQLKAGGHGVAQIVSLLSILCIIVITGARRILVLDEVLSGVSHNNLMIIDQILWTFTEIGFQFIINDHGFIPKGSHVYHLESVNDVSHLKSEYISKVGVYRQSTDLNAKLYDYTEEDHKIAQMGLFESGMISEDTEDDADSTGIRDIILGTGNSEQVKAGDILDI